MTLHDVAGGLEPRDPIGERTALFVVDVQERFRPAMQGFDSMVAGCLRLVRTFRILGLPLIVTEQYPKGLGRTVAELQEPLAGVPVFEKTAFSALGCPQVREKLALLEARSIVVCGIETHVCVHQTVRDLLRAGYRVEVAVDAVESRHSGDRDVALRRMENSGAVLTTTEMAAFELLVDARHPRFKEVQALFK